MRALPQARRKRAAEEADEAARLAHDVKAEFAREAAARDEAKAALVTYLRGNEENKRLREAEKARQQAEDLEYMRKFEAILDKQQAERAARLAKLQEWQARASIGLERCRACPPNTCCGVRWQSQ